MIDPKDIESLDGLFKQALDGAKTPVPRGVWEGIAASTSGSAIVGTSVIPKLLGIKGAAILGTVAVITSVAIYMNQPSTENPTKNQAVESAVELNKTEAEDYFVEEETQDSQTDHDLGGIVNTEPDYVPGSNKVASTPGSRSNQSNNISEIGPRNESKPVDEKKVSIVTILPPEVTLVSRAETTCLNQQIQVDIISNVPVRTTRWLLNDKFISEGGSTIVLLLTKTGVNTVKAIIELEDGRMVDQTKILIAEKVSAGFTYKINENNLTLSAENSVAAHAWYINNLRIASIGSSVTTVLPNTNGVEVIHIAGNLRGCSDTSVQTIGQSTCDFEPKIYAGFSPELKDGINDEWVIEMPMVDSYYLVIFASDKSIVFETFDQSIHWNGKRLNQGDLLPTGFYTYQLVYECGGNSKAKSGKLAIK